MTRGRRLVPWEDPEPPDAQARAEAVLAAEWNRDKITRLAGESTTRLRMHITTLVDHTTGIAGFATRLAGETASVDERLARLGAAEPRPEKGKPSRPLGPELRRR